MDLDTENRIAAILMKEAAELRRQAEKDGVHVYLQQPKARGRPNSRFLTATVLGVQQANRAVEVNEMWRVRQKELELNDKLKGRRKGESHEARSSSRSTSKGHASNDASASCSSSKRVSENGDSREGKGLRDEEVEEFLHSRVKRGRGTVGSRMDETGPYLPPSPDSQGMLVTSPNYKEHRVFGPEKPLSLKSSASSDEESHENRRKKVKKSQSGNSNQHSKKHKSKEKSSYKKKRRKEEKRSRHHK